MSEYEALRSEIMTVMDSLNEYGRTVNRYMAVVNDQVTALWADNAELRDEINAVANRLENLTRRSDGPHLILLPDAPGFGNGWVAACTCGWVSEEMAEKDAARLAFVEHLPFRDPAEVAQAIVNDANRSTLREVGRDD